MPAALLLPLINFTFLTLCLLFFEIHPNNYILIPKSFSYIAIDVSLVAIQAISGKIMRENRRMTSPAEREGQKGEEKRY